METFVKKACMLAFAVLGSLTGTEAQDLPASQICAKEQVYRKQLLKQTLADPAEDHYDVRQVTLDISLDNNSVALKGEVLTTAVVVSATMPAYVFELNNLLAVDSVKLNGQVLPCTTNGDVRTVNLPAPLPQNATFTARVYYQGSIVSGGQFFGTGIRNQSSPSWGNDVTFTMSEPYASKDWWPVKQSLRDKIDSADIRITVPATLKAGSNGVLQNITPLPGNKHRYEWKTRYPIDYYLISLAVSEYVDYSYYVHFPGTNDSMLVQNYVYDNPQTLPFWKSRIDSVGLMIQYLSQLFGRYPFWQEKYGHCMAPLSGGMEHQTMTTQGNFGTTLSVHELGHQWFGDNVTCGTWKDIWLNEGFAAYTEYLFVEHFWPSGQAYNYMLDKHNEVLSEPDGSVYVNDTTNVSRIFDGRLTYDKGAAVVHSLRFLFDDDSLFFQALRAYQAQFAGKTATTADFAQVAEQVLGRDVDTFINEWVYGEGHPIYMALWNQVGNTVYVKLTQLTSHPSVSLFHNPIALRFYSGQGDTTVRVQQNTPTQVFSFTWDKSMSDMDIDPDNWIVNETGLIVRDLSLDLESIVDNGYLVYPNPTTSGWYVGNLSETTGFELFDLSGRRLREGTAMVRVEIKAAELPAGVYLLKLRNTKGTDIIKLIKH